MDDVKIRAAAKTDIGAIAAIYEPYVLHSTCTFAELPPSKAEWADWFRMHADKRYPALVAEADGKIIGWGSLSPRNTRCAYRFAVEDSIYVAESSHRRGVGRRILAELLDAAKAAGLHAVVAQIADDHVASEALHASLGFQSVGRLRQIGHKFGRWIDVCIWLRVLDERATRDNLK